MVIIILEDVSQQQTQQVAKKHLLPESSDFPPLSKKARKDSPKHEDSPTGKF